MAATAPPGGVLDWNDMRRRRVVPSFSLPSSMSAIRAHLSEARLQEVCSRLSQEQFSDQCYREAIVVPVLLQGATASDQQMRSHVEFSRQSLKPVDSVGGVQIGSTMAKDQLFMEIGRSEVTAKVGSTPAQGFQSSAASAPAALALPAQARPLTSHQPPKSARALRPLQKEVMESGPLSARHTASSWHPQQVLPESSQASSWLQDTSKKDLTTMEEILAAVEASPEERIRSAGGNSWSSTPLPQPSVGKFIAFEQSQAPQSRGTTGILEQALTLQPSPVHRQIAKAQRLGDAGWLPPRPSYAPTAKPAKTPPKASSGGAPAAAPKAPRAPLAPLPELRRLGAPKMHPLQR